MTYANSLLFCFNIQKKRNAYSCSQPTILSFQNYHTLYPKVPYFRPVTMALLMPKSHAYDLQPAYIVICYPHHQNFRCLTCKTPLLESMVSQTLWEHLPNPLGTPPKPFGEVPQTLWGTFPNPLGGCQSTM